MIAAEAHVPRERPSALVEVLATGGASFVLFPLLWALRGVLGLDRAELAVGFATFHLATVINDPHFAVTYLLFYRGARERALGAAWGPAMRARYVFAGFVIPLLLAGWAAYAIAVGSAATMGWLVQLMYLLVGWHYVKQGFGVLTVLSARRGTFYGEGERRVILAHCFAAWAHAWANPADPGTVVEERGVVFTTVVHPAWLDRATLAVFAATGLAAIAMLVVKARRERKLPAPWPVVGLVVSSWWWTIASSRDPLFVYVIPALHSVQYLYFVWMLRSGEARELEGPPHFGRPAALRMGLLAAASIALGWLLLHGLPGAFDAVLSSKQPTLRGERVGLGATPYLAAFFVVVNVHHYFMDNVIWRRENAETRYLKG